MRQILVMNLVLFCTVGVIYTYKNCAVSPSALNQVEVGMTREQVIDILGPPGGDLFWNITGNNQDPYWCYSVWNEMVPHNDVARVEFDSNGRVVYAGF